MSISINSFSKKAYKAYREAGMTICGACGMLGNQYSESAGFIANRVEFLLIQRLREDGMIYTDESYTTAVNSKKISKASFMNPRGKQYGYGLSQWTSPNRKVGLYERTVAKGKSIADEDAQIEFTLYELKNSYPSTFKVLCSAKTVKEASDYVLVHYESPANAEALKSTRASYGTDYYNYFKGVDTVTANDVLKIMQSWVGMDRAKGTHKPIIDIYNEYGAKHGYPRGYKVSYTDDYCDTTVSAAFIKSGAIDMIGGAECGVEEHINLFKKKGIWNEDGTINPEVGYIICYNWGENTQPNDGYADHIGFVLSKNANNTFNTIEGNMGGKVGIRYNVKIGAGNIRGYAIPKYADSKTNDNTESGVYMFNVNDVKSGSTGNDVKLLQRLLKSNGCKGTDNKNLKIDGQCGDNTVSAIKKYQSKKGLTKDGWCGAATWKSILLR